jgi:dihydroxyacetone kinase-like predicted kinase
MTNTHGIISINGDKYISAFFKDIIQIKKTVGDVIGELIIKLKNKKSEILNLTLGSKKLKVQIVNFNNKSIKFSTLDGKTINVKIWYLIGKI